MIDWPEALNADQFFLGARIDEGAGDRVALRTDRGASTYREVDARASSYARLLIGLDVGREDRVVISLPDGPDYVAALFGTLRIGAVVVMVNPGLTTQSIRGILGRARPAAVIIHEEHFSSISTALEGDGPPLVLVGDELRLPQASVAAVATAPGNPAIWLFSGGTTGAPKAVPQTHRSLVNTTRLYGHGVLGLGPDDITISVPKLFFGYATGSNLLFPFSVGASTVLFPDPPTPGRLFDLIERHRPTVLVNVPSAINQMVSAADASTRDLGSLRLTTSAGEALPESLYHRWLDTFGVELLDGLGTAEMWHIFVSNRPGQARPGTVGQVVPGFEIKVCDDRGDQVAPGEVGRLWVRGDSLGLGYWDEPELTAEAFHPPWFAGSDLVSVDEDGYVTHRGRADDAIKVKGKWFRPQELESVLLEHPAVAECAVVAVEDRAGLAAPVAFVVMSGEVTEDELVAWSLEHLEPYKRPRRVLFVESLPQTHLGKVDRSALRRNAAVSA